MASATLTQTIFPSTPLPDIITSPIANHEHSLDTSSLQVSPPSNEPRYVNDNFTLDVLSDTVMAEVADTRISLSSFIEKNRVKHSHTRTGPIIVQKAAKCPLTNVVGSLQSPLQINPPHYRQVTLTAHPSQPIPVISGRDMARALEEQTKQPLPLAENVFPWLHARTMLKPPTCFSSVLLVKADGNLGAGCLQGSVTADCILSKVGSKFKVYCCTVTNHHHYRNFHLQASLVASVSDIIVYGGSREEIRGTMEKISYAQADVSRRFANLPQRLLLACFDTFLSLETRYPHLVHQHSKTAIVSAMLSVGSTPNLAAKKCPPGRSLLGMERDEIWKLSAPSAIAHNVYLGPSPCRRGVGIADPFLKDFDILVECHEHFLLNPELFWKLVGKSPSRVGSKHSVGFVASGSLFTCTDYQCAAIVDICLAIYSLANGVKLPRLPTKIYEGHYENDDVEGEKEEEEEEKGRETEEENQLSSQKVYIHCGDGYTESSLLAIAYYAFSRGIGVMDACLRLHREEKRNFFAYQSDMMTLMEVEPLLLKFSPALAKGGLPTEPALSDDLDCSLDWMSDHLGAFPSRITDYLYLGSMADASNIAMLQALGIGQVLSIGETVAWSHAHRQQFGSENMYLVEDVADNGWDGLGPYLDACMEIIEKGRRAGKATLVHCRVGVSRSATVCIAYLMQAYALSFTQAYCRVRARRLNVIIQPTTLFVYEMLKWQEELQRRRGEPIRRDMEWHEIAREIHMLNSPYQKGAC